MNVSPDHGGTHLVKVHILNNCTRSMPSRLSHFSEFYFGGGLESYTDHIRCRGRSVDVIIPTRSTRGQGVITLSPATLKFSFLSLSPEKLPSNFCRSRLSFASFHTISPSFPDQYPWSSVRYRTTMSQEDTGKTTKLRVSLENISFKLLNN